MKIHLIYGIVNTPAARLDNGARTGYKQSTPAMRPPKIPLDESFRRPRAVLSAAGRRPALRLRAGRSVGACLLVLPAFHVAFALLVGAGGLLLSFIHPPVTSLMLHRTLVDRYPARPMRYVPLDRLPRFLPRMFVKIEDSTFYEHHGIDPAAVRDAIRINRQLGYIYYGGSTITQQLARTLFLSPARTYLRKYLEAIVALELDLLLSKRRILELYVNAIEYGKGVYGIEAAARHHFRKGSGKLSLDQYRRLVTIVVSPLRYDTTNFGRRRALSWRYEYLLRNFP